MKRITFISQDEYNTLIEALDNMEDTSEVRQARNALDTRSYVYDDNEVCAYLPFVYDQEDAPTRQHITDQMEMEIDEGMLDWGNFTAIYE